MPEESYPYVNGAGVTDAVYEQLMCEVTGVGRIGLRQAGQALSVPFVFADSSGRQVKVRANASYLVRGFRWDSEEGSVRSIDANTSGNPRLDLVVLRLDRTDFTVRLQILKGTPAATPTLPTLTQQLGPTGRYEVPIASVRVNNNAVTIASGDVSALENWLAPNSTVGHSAARPPLEPGGTWTEYDTGRIYGGLQSGWHLIGEPGTYTKLEGAAGWDPDRDFAYVQRRNGWTTLQALMYRAANTADVASGVDSRLFTLAEQYRPQTDQKFYMTGSMQGNSPVRAYCDSETGNVTLLDHAVLKAGQFIHIGPVTYPSR